MTALERSPVFQRGPRFYRVDGHDMFEHRIDASNMIGPRVATKIDKQNHSDLWAAYLEQLTVEENAKLAEPAPAKRKR